MKIEASMLHVDDFLEDYERHFQTIEEIGQDGFWVAEPYTAMPWMEAMLGCEVLAGDNSFISEPALKSEDVFSNVRNILESPWYEKYMEFTKKLVRLSNGRFPVGEPIMRGPSDIMGALLGQTNMIYTMNDEPEKISELASIVTNSFIQVINNQFDIIPEFHGGNSLGFYHIWTPGKCIWFQEDLSAILSPQWYKNFILESDMNICETCDYSAVHLHPVSFHILNYLLGLNKLKAVEINKDVGGPSIKEMMPVLEKILVSGKRLILWGTLDDEDIRLIKLHLPQQPIFMHIVAETTEKAKNLMNFI